MARQDGVLAGLAEGGVGRGARAQGAAGRQGSAATALPDGSRGVHSSILDEPSPNAADETSVGAELRLVREADRILVETGRSIDGPAELFHQREVERSIDLGRVRCWLAGRKQTLTHPKAAVLFIAVYDP